MTHKNWERTHAEDIVGNGSNLDFQMELLSFSLMPAHERERIGKERPDLAKAYSKVRGEK